MNTKSNLDGYSKSLYPNKKTKSLEYAKIGWAENRGNKVFFKNCFAFF